MKRRIGAMTLALAMCIGGAAGLDHWVETTQLPALDVARSTEVLDRNGELLRAYTVEDGRWRLAVARAGVDPLLVQMLLAYEDKRFHHHPGVDGIAMGRAVVQAVWNGRVVSGGSTLTMQVARLLEDGPTGRWDGKLRQLRVALALERRVSKSRILELYLNRAPYGGNVEGVRAAARIWFGKPPARLTPAEAALLVALPQSPETRRPDRFPEAARLARARVLDRAVEAGVITAEAAAAALRDPVPTRRAEMPARAAHLADRARGESPALATHRLTIDADLQARLEALASRAVADHGADALSIAILAADHHTGEVLASVGSAGYRADGRQGFVDMTRAPRSPGSTLKPLVYGLGFDEGLVHPQTMIEDRPMRFGNYAPENFDGAYRGTVTVAEALRLSLNLPVVAVLDGLGAPRLMAAMERAGMQPRLPGKTAPGLAVALGGVGVTVEELTALYAALANGGMAVPLRHRVETMSQPSVVVLSPEAAWQVGHILSAMPPPPNAPRNRIAYKTGTSYGHRDAWAVGFDGRHVVTVWMGRPDGTPVPGAFGADVAAPVLFEVFSRVKPELTPLPTPPASVLLLSSAALPTPLREFRPRGAVFAAPADAPELVFPPDGAVVNTGGAPLFARVAEGVPPFTWLANGTPVLVGASSRQAELSLPGPGHVQLAVIDAEGRAARVQVELE
jgi:penicillin-binding protein 1C